MSDCQAKLEAAEAKSRSLELVVKMLREKLREEWCCFLCSACPDPDCCEDVKCPQDRVDLMALAPDQAITEIGLMDAVIEAVGKMRIDEFGESCKDPKECGKGPEPCAFWPVCKEYAALEAHRGKRGE